MSDVPWTQTRANGTTTSPQPRHPHISSSTPAPPPHPLPGFYQFFIPYFAELSYLICWLHCTHNNPQEWFLSQALRMLMAFQQNEKRKKYIERGMGDGGCGMWGHAAEDPQEKDIYCQ